MESEARTEYRIIERSEPMLPPFAIYLVTTNESGQVEGAYQPGFPEGGSLLELQALLRQMCQALDKPVLKLDDLVPRDKRVTIADLGYANEPSLKEVRAWAEARAAGNTGPPPEWVERLIMAEDAHDYASFRENERALFKQFLEGTQ